MGRYIGKGIEKPNLYKRIPNYVYTPGDKT